MYSWSQWRVFKFIEVFVVWGQRRMQSSNLAAVKWVQELRFLNSREMTATWYLKIDDLIFGNLQRSRQLRNCSGPSEQTVMERRRDWKMCAAWKIYENSFVKTAEALIFPPRGFTICVCVCTCVPPVCNALAVGRASARAFVLVGSVITFGKIHHAA